MDRPPDLPVDRLRRSLLAFWDRGRRELPWRGVSDPYAVWVSEVMLQQTRVDTVLPYYRRWMARFPDLESLAEASTAEVLKCWEGLGYYGRARRLHQGARQVRDRYGGRLPRTAGELRQLPGVGPYTAGAVASIAFGAAEPAVDGNVHRVLARLLDEPSPSPAALTRTAAALVDPERPGDFNQALMELGATVCAPRSPDCPECPWKDECRARARGTVLERPSPRRRSPVARADFAVAVVTGPGGALLLVRRPPGGLLGGLWEFPSRRTEPGRATAEQAWRAAVEAGTRGEPVSPPVPLTPVPHAFSHLRATYVPFLFTLRGTPREALSGPDGEGPAGGEDGAGRTWRDADEVGDLALPVAQRRILAAVPGAVGGRGSGRPGPG